MTSDADCPAQQTETDGSYECPDGREYKTLTAYLNHLAQHHPEET